MPGRSVNEITSHRDESERTRRPEATQKMLGSLGFLDVMMAMEETSSPSAFTARTTLVDGRLYHRNEPSSVGGISSISERRYCQKLAHSPEPTQSEPSCPNARAETGAGINNVAAGAEDITDDFKKRATG